MRKIKLKQWDKIEIDWQDSITNTSGWKEPAEFDWKGHVAATYHMAIGYYVNETKSVITICQAYAVDNFHMFIGAFTIPKGCIIKIRKLK
jgi:hypothetical protein